MRYKGFESGENGFCMSWTRENGEANIYIYIEIQNGKDRRFFAICLAEPEYHESGVANDLLYY